MVSYINPGAHTVFSSRRYNEFDTGLQSLHDQDSSGISKTVPRNGHTWPCLRGVPPLKQTIK